MRADRIFGDDGLEAASVIRTDYGDEPTWRAVAAELVQPWGEDEEYPARVHFVDDPAWSGATPDAVSAAAHTADARASVVFLVDSVTLRHSHFALLAVRVAGPEADTPGPSAFRLEPGAVQDVHGQLFIDNLSFEDFAEAAERDPEHVLRAPY